jgi:hypothetical protein
MKNSLSIKKILAVFILLAGVLFSFAAFASEPEIVLFCTSWNMKCRDAKKVCSAIAMEQGIKFTELDVDRPNAEQQAMDLGLSVPTSIPFAYYILDHKGSIVGAKPYTGESAQDFRKKIMRY